mgnify:CR=1 FL=1
MLKEKAGALAGQIWEALNGTEGLTQKQIKKAAKLKADKDFFLGLGWLLREDKVVTSEVEGEIFVKISVRRRFLKLIKKCVGTSFCMLSTHFFVIL